jgi:hypothetical protein
MAKLKARKARRLAGVFVLEGRIPSMHTFRTKSYRILALLSCLAAALLDAQSLSVTRIEDTLFNADGTTVEGVAKISWKAFTAIDGSTVAQSSIDADIVGGLLAVDLTPNDGATPSGTSYRVDYELENGVRYTETWIVPQSANPLTLQTIRVSLPPTPGTVVSQGQVAGLVQALDQKANLTGPTDFIGPVAVEEPAADAVTFGLEAEGGASGVYFKLPALSASSTYTLPIADGLPNQQLTTDGTGRLFWSSEGLGVGGSAYETIQSAGTVQTQRNVLNFSSGLVAFDDPGSTRTTVVPLFGTTTGTLTQGNDFRLSNARAPLPHATTHSAGSSDGINPVNIGALKRTNDFMLGTSFTDPVLKIQGATGQSAPLQEWRDGDGALAALVTPSGSAFFREMGVSAKVGLTTASQFFQINGLNKFAFSVSDTALDVFRYDNIGLFKDSAMKIFRNAGIETSVPFKVRDATAGSGTLAMTGNYVDYNAVAAPSPPTAGFGRVFLNSTNGQLSITKSDGTVVSLEGGGGTEGGGGGGSFGSFVDAETPAGAVNGSNAVFLLSQAPNPATSLQLTKNGVVQQAGVNFTLSGATITFLSGSIPQSGNTLLAWYRVDASNAGGDLGGQYPSPTVSGIQGRGVSIDAPQTGECLGWNTLTALWEPGPCAVVRDALTWHFSGTPGAGVQPMILAIPDGMSGAVLKEVRIVVTSTGASSTTYNVERCATGCVGTSPVFAPIYSSDRTLTPATKTAVGGQPDTTVVNAGDQFRVNLVALGSGVSGLTVMLVFEHNAYALLDGQFEIDCQSYCGPLWSAAGLPANPFGQPAKLGDACLCFGPPDPSRAG